jgi:hypothetical protein
MAKAKDNEQDNMVPSGAADVQVDTSKDVHWDANNPSDKQKAKMYAETKKPEGNAPDAGMTPEEADKKFNQPKEQVTPMNGEDNES